MDMPSAQQAIACNKDAWDQSADLHKTTETWSALLNGVRDPGFSCLDPTLTGLLQDIGVAGKEVLQVCCNNGRESLSLFGLGARSVVGVDQSRAFLQQARELADVSPHNPEFIESDTPPVAIPLARALRHCLGDHRRAGLDAGCGAVHAPCREDLETRWHAGDV